MAQTTKNIDSVAFLCFTFYGSFQRECYQRYYIISLCAFIEFVH